MFDSLARLADRRARRVGLLAIAFFLLAGALGGSVADRLDPYGADDPGTESVEAREALLDAGFHGPGAIVLIHDAPVSSPATRARVGSISRELRGNPQVSSVSGYYQTGSRAFVSEDGRSTYLAIGLKPTNDKQWQEAGDSVVEQMEGRRGVLVGGGSVAQEQVNKQVEEDLQKAEMLAFPLLFLLSFVFFRSLVAALLPVMTGVLAIVGTFLVLRGLSEVGSISIFALNLTTGLGLGLAIDYSLFIVSRYREEIAKDGPGLPAMRRVLATAGRTVFFSSLTVAAALASLIVFPQRFLYSMGFGGALVTLLAAAVSLTVLPAVLTLLGTRVNSLAPQALRRRAEAETRPDEDGFWYRLSRFVMRRPAPIATVCSLFLIVLGIPFFAIKFTAADPAILPAEASARQVYDAMQDEFPPYRDTPIWVSVDGGGAATAAQVRRQVLRTEDVATALPPRPLPGDLRVIETISGDTFRSEASQATVEDLREIDVQGATVQVSGATADFVDFQSSLARHLPLAVAIIVLSTLIILFLMTGSVVLPVKSLIMNLLNLSAVFGLLVLIFQEGRLESLFDYTSQGALEQTMPILLFAVAFGLSTDYAVFLLSRIKEARDRGASDSESVAIGLERTGRIVTAAALMFAVAIGAFATSKIIFIKQNGVGTALAVLIDASIIRALLVPSLMELLGKWNWWAPAPLRRLHERWGISETQVAEPEKA
jgi:RND superfamily putative drug exporter